jgi:hypothetical protein
MSDSQTIIECDQCGAFRGHDPYKPFSSHDCATGQWGMDNAGVSPWVMSRVCANCGGKAVGFAMIDHHRYCHDGSSEMPPSLVGSDSCFGLAWRTSARDEQHSVGFEVTSRDSGVPRAISTTMQYGETGPAILSVSVDDFLQPRRGPSTS